MSQTATLDAVALTEISASDDNVRTHMDKAKLKELAKSIASEGVLMPLRLQRLEGGGYKVIAGHRRLAAIEIANADLGATIKTVPAIIDEDAGDQDRVVQMLVENLQREDIDPIDEAEGYQRLIGFDMTGKDIATRTGRSAGHVSKRIKLLTLPKKVLDQVRKGDLTIETALELADANAPELVEEALKIGGYNPVGTLERLVQRQQADVKINEAILLATQANIPVATSAWNSRDYAHQVGKEGAGWVAVNEYGSGAGGLRGLTMKEKDHRKEPCRGLLVIMPRHETEARRIQECCTDPARHLAKGESKVKAVSAQSSSPSGTMTDKEKAERAATMAANKARREATKARDAVITAKINAKLPKGLDEFIAEWLVFSLTGGDMATERRAMEHACRWLGIEVKDSAGYGNAKYRVPLRALAARSAADQQRVALALVLGMEHSAMIEQPAWCAQDTGAVRRGADSAIVTVTAGWGYELSPQEKIDLKLAKPKKVRTPKPKAEAHPDPDVDAVLNDELEDPEVEDPEQLDDEQLDEANVA